KESSVLQSAPLLERPLLIIHGTDDDNVYFTHSIKLCDALYRAGKPFEFVPLVGFTHMVTDPRVTEMLQERIATFFIRELGKPEGGSSRKKTE
ncbi:MAG TPA: prolyl oligopeptidase family serine peptidase, partial [Candidatus Eisenbacteria bacterium]|nr:prolyl oligopeptidase family serine peptidase [Candidatus Eisenbacteria bacterium]